MDRNRLENGTGAVQRKPQIPWTSLLLVVLLALGLTQALQWWQNRDQARSLRALTQPGDIVMYVSNTCVYCLKAEAWLSMHDIPWTACNIDHEASCRQAFEAQGSPGTPLMQVAGQWQLGFNPEWVLQVLRQRVSFQGIDATLSPAV